MALIASGCFGDDTPPDTTLAAGLSPEEVVTTLMDLIIQGRFEETGDLTDSAHAALLTLAEGADASEVVEAVEAGGEDVAANFWSGFAQTLDPGVAVDDFEVSAGEAVTQDNEEFVTVTLTPAEGDPRYFVVRRAEEWIVDLMATFGPVLAERLIPPIESLLSSAHADASKVLGYLAGAAPSLRVSTSRPDLPPEAHQSLLALIERVTRSG